MFELIRRMRYIPYVIHLKYERFPNWRERMFIFRLGNIRSVEVRTLGPVTDDTVEGSKRSKERFGRKKVSSLYYYKRGFLPRIIKTYSIALVRYQIGSYWELVNKELSRELPADEPATVTMVFGNGKGFKTDIDKTRFKETKDLRIYVISRIGEIIAEAQASNDREALLRAVGSWNALKDASKHFSKIHGLIKLNRIEIESPFGKFRL